VLAEPVPGQFEHVQDVPLGDGLLDPAGEDLGGLLGAGAAGAGQDPLGVDPLVGREKDDTSLPELVLDLRAEVAEPSHAFDGLADHGDEPPVGPLGLSEQVCDAAVAGDRDVEALMLGAMTAQV
jgi:hypothetical protein